MYLAEIHGKLSSENENKEDILTSNVFSFFKYSDREIFLLPFLKSLGLDISKEDALQTEFLFWPSYSDGTQPDLVIITGSYYLLVEAKYHSGFGKETLSRKHQLIREIEGGVLEAETLDKKFKILTVTADYNPKSRAKEGVPPHHQSDLIPINWQKIAFIVYSILETEPNISPEMKLFAEDLYALLLKKNLRNFEGINAFNLATGSLKVIHDNIFFQANTASYRGDFIGFLAAMETLPQLSPSPDILFFGLQKHFFQFHGILNSSMLTNPDDNLFFKGGNHYEQT